MCKLLLNSPTFLHLLLSVWGIFHRKPFLKYKIHAYHCFNTSSSMKMNSVELGGGVTGVVRDTRVRAQ